MVITKLDVLDMLDEIPVCTGYRVHGELVDCMPATIDGLEAIEPVYEKLPGWRTSTRGASSVHQLPAKAWAYLMFLEEQSGVEVGCVSVGPERNETMIVKGSRLEKLIAAKSH